jgi:Meckel syndrome type 1 protein
LATDLAAPALRVAEAPPPAPPQPPPPMRQVAPIAVALAFAPAGAGGFQLSLEPGELGRVEIRVQREGEAHAVRITAERPETLALLLRDRQELDRGLADAGLRVEAKGIEFSLSSSTGGREQRGREESRSDATPRGRGPAGSATAAEPTPTRAVRGLLDLNI